MKLSQKKKKKKEFDRGGSEALEKPVWSLWDTL